MCSLSWLDWWLYVPLEAVASAPRQMVAMLIKGKCVFGLYASATSIRGNLVNEAGGRSFSCANNA